MKAILKKEYLTIGCTFCGGRLFTNELNRINYIVCENCGAVVSFAGKEHKLPAIKAYMKYLDQREIT